MIVPAGNKKMDWSPKNQDLTKTASVGAQEEVNPLYEAAKKFAMSTNMCETCGKGCDECSCEKSSAIDVSAPASSDKASSDKASPFGAAPEGMEASSDEKVKEAVETIENAVVEIKEICDIKSDSKGDAESVTLDVGESKPISDSVTIEVGEEPEIPGVSGTEILEKKSEPCLACGATASAKKETKTAWNFDKKSDEKSAEKGSSDNKKSDEKSAEKSSSSSDSKSDAKMDKAASTEEEFTRFAKLSPVNKKKVADYWTNMLGFPKDYVALMVKDYEK